MHARLRARIDVGFFRLDVVFYRFRKSRVRFPVHTYYSTSAAFISAL